MQSPRSSRKAPGARRATSPHVASSSFRPVQHSQAVATTLSSRGRSPPKEIAVIVFSTIVPGPKVQLPAPSPRRRSPVEHRVCVRRRGRPVERARPWCRSGAPLTATSGCSRCWGAGPRLVPLDSLLCGRLALQEPRASEAACRASAGHNFRPREASRGALSARPLWNPAAVRAPPVLGRTT